MKIANTELINILLGSGLKSNLLVDSLSIVLRLIKKYGSAIFSKNYIAEISKVDSTVSNVLQILKSSKKTGYQDIKGLIQSTKSLAKDYKPEFQVSGDSKEHGDKLKDFLDQKFQNAKIHTNAQDKTGIHISGEGWYYKKDLDSDLKKILN
ncbi:MAG TPA: hypothetical protein P5060_02210 [Candidatus Absconditabacterales bacterium]|nr:hypothetical protein [Candidatus Absconditabacterales bacterium]